MLGKIVVLHGIPMEDGFQVDYGIKHNRLGKNFDYEFVTFCYQPISSLERKTYILGGHWVKDERDGFKEIILFGSDKDVLSKYPDEKEEYLLVIIPNAMQIVTNLHRIAGRYLTEGVFEMHAGDTIEVSKDSFGPREVYMAVQAGNEMFLIKKNR